MYIKQLPTSCMAILIQFLYRSLRNIACTHFSTILKCIFIHYNLYVYIIQDQNYVLLLTNKHQKSFKRPSSIIDV